MKDTGDNLYPEFHLEEILKGLELKVKQLRPSSKVEFYFEIRDFFAELALFRQEVDAYIACYPNPKASSSKQKQNSDSFYEDLVSAGATLEEKLKNLSYIE